MAQQVEKIAVNPDDLCKVPRTHRNSEKERTHTLELSSDLHMSAVVCVHMQIETHTYIHTYIHTHTHTHLYTHARTHAM